MKSTTQLLGDKADSLLSFNKPKIARERLHLPGPDFVDRIFAVSDRNNRVLVNLQRLFGRGRLGGAGHFSILPVDPGDGKFGGPRLPQKPDLFDAPNNPQLANARGCKTASLP